jgi:hypothetical protein
MVPNTDCDAHFSYDNRPIPREPGHGGFNKI